jgi:hypothetical protein
MAPLPVLLLPVPGIVLDEPVELLPWVPVALPPVLGFVVAVPPESSVLGMPDAAGFLVPGALPVGLD